MDRRWLARAHSDLTHNGQTVGIAQRSISRRMGTQTVAHPENGSFGPKRGGNAGRPATTWLNFKTASSERRRTRRPHLVWLFSQGVFLTGKSADRKWAVAAGAGGGKKGAATPRPGVFFWRGTAGSKRRRLHSTERFNAAAARCVHFTSIGRSRRDGCPPSRAPPRPARKSRPSAAAQGFPARRPWHVGPGESCLGAAGAARSLSWSGRIPVSTHQLPRAPPRPWL